MPCKYEINNDKTQLDIEMIHAFLSQSYWSKAIPRALVETAIANSLCFGVYVQGRQIGFARVISDYASFAYLADVFIVESERGQGIAKSLISTILAHPQLQGLRRWLLMTRDAHGLYGQFGFSGLASPDRVMEIAKPDIYLKLAAQT